MIIHEVAQGSVDWYALRLGIPTASEFHKIITPMKGELSKSADKYMDVLLAEKLLNRPMESLEGIEHIERGKELEPLAVLLYDFENGVETKAVGFITTDDGLIGASPDRLVVGSKKGVEIKCPSPQVHVGYMRRAFDEKYIPQVQGQMYVAELESVDRYSYHPEFPPVTTVTERDDAYIAKLSKALAEFNERLFEAYELIRQQGYFVERDKLALPHEREYEEAHAATSMIMAG